MRVQQVPNSPYFIHYDDNGYCCISKSRKSQESIPESEMQEFLDAVANGLLYIEKERKSRYQRIEEAEKEAFAKGEAEGREDELLSTVRELKEVQASRAEYERKLQYEVYVALVEDFKEFIDTTVKADKDSYKHVDLFNGKPLEESVTHTVPLEDDKAQLLAAACMDLANSTLWLYYHQNKFKDTEFAEVVNNNYPKYQVRVQQEMNQEGGQFYLRSWYSLAQKISRECQLKAFEGYKPKEQMTYVNIYLLVYAAMKSLKNGSLSRIMANVEHDSDKIGNLAFYFFTYILEVLERPLG